MNKKILVLEAAILTALEYLFWRLGLLKTLLFTALYRVGLSVNGESQAFILICGGLAVAVNLFVLSPLIYLLVRQIYYRAGRMGAMRSEYGRICRGLINYLASLNTCWGVYSGSASEQNANTCEALLALHLTGLHTTRKDTYREAFQRVIDESTDQGLSSRTIGRPTVINSGMLLYLAAMDRDDQNGLIRDYSRFDEMAQNLWHLRSDGGWGVLVDKARESDVRLVSTWWALYALERCGYATRNDYAQMILSVFEKSRHGTFGYTAADSPRLVVTAMYLLLYFRMPKKLQRRIRREYSVSDAVSFIYEQFVLRRQEVEYEYVDGMFFGGKALIHTPWKHMAGAFAIAALLTAANHGRLDLTRLGRLFDAVGDLVDQEVSELASSELCYEPQDLELPVTGHLTYPSAYLAIALDCINT